MHATVRVDLADRSYDVLAGAGLFGRVPDMVQEALGEPPGAGWIVADSALEARARSLQCDLHARGWSVRCSLLDASEQVKSLDSASSLFSEMARARNPIFGRDAVVFALGGGVTGDLAGFVASTFKRGVRWVNIPTTLLAMVDASVGGKTGVNLDTGTTLHKNVVGTFHQPSLVVIDADLLATLPVRHYRCGLAECVKHAMLCRCGPGNDDAELFVDTRRFIEGGIVPGRDVPSLRDLIVRNVALKAHVVGSDERETASDVLGGRALLNLGHTYAHVIEGGVPQEAQVLLHGEAVALGLIAASRTACVMHRVSEEFVGAVTRLIGAAGLPTRVAGLPGNETMLRLMRSDKKARGDHFRMILPIERVRGEFGYAEVVSDPPDSAVAAGWDAIRGD
jgi:3-dehydroquinate synthetase